MDGARKDELGLASPGEVSRELDGVKICNVVAIKWRDVVGFGVDNVEGKFILGVVERELAGVGSNGCCDCERRRSTGCVIVGCVVVGVGRLSWISEEINA